MTLRTSLTALVLICATGTAQAASISLKFLGATTLPKETNFENVQVGGISGLEQDADGSFYALSDDRGDDGRPPRFYKLDLDYDQTGFYGVSVKSQTLLKRKDGTPLPTDKASIDPEAIRRAPNGNLYISSEGNFSTTPGELVQPMVGEYKSDGTFIRKIPTPKIYDYADGLTKGGRNNKLFEGTAVTPSGKIFTSNEEALLSDGPASSETEGSISRVTALDPHTGATAQYAYKLPPIPREGTAGAPGLVELLAIDETSFIALERSYASGKNFVSVVLTTTEGATDILGKTGLGEIDYKAMTREVLVSMDDPYEGVDIDNMEAMSFGKVLANGNRTLVIASDDNFNPRYQNTLFMAFEVQTSPAPIPLPATAPLLIMALAGAFALRRRV